MHRYSPEQPWRMVDDYLTDIEALKQINSLRTFWARQGNPLGEFAVEDMEQRPRAPASAAGE